MMIIIINLEMENRIFFLLSLASLSIPKLKRENLKKKQRKILIYSFVPRLGRDRGERQAGRQWVVSGYTDRIRRRIRRRKKMIMIRNNIFLKRIGIISSSSSSSSYICKQMIRGSPLSLFVLSFKFVVVVCMGGEGEEIKRREREQLKKLSCLAYKRERETMSYVTCRVCSKLLL